MIFRVITFWAPLSEVIFSNIFIFQIKKQSLTAAEEL